MTVKPYVSPDGTVYRFWSNPAGDLVADGKMPSGTLVQFVANSLGILYGMRPISVGKWGPIAPVRNPERFGEWKTLKDLRQWVEKFETSDQEATG